MMVYEFFEIGRKWVGSWEYEEYVPLYISGEEMFGGKVRGEDDPSDYAGGDERFEV